MSGVVGVEIRHVDKWEKQGIAQVGDALFGKVEWGGDSSISNVSFLGRIRIHRTADDCFVANHNDIHPLF